jgi:hypothetical protein
VTVFDLLFLVFVLGSVITLISCLFLLRADRRRAFRNLRLLGIALILYLAACAATAALEPRRILPLGEPQCFDDWCIQIDSVTKLGASTPAKYEVNAHIFSTAKRVPQREEGIAVYLEGTDRRRYAALANSADKPFDLRLNPGESVAVARVFQPPEGATPGGIVVTHERFPIEWFVIGEGASLFHREPLVALR